MRILLISSNMETAPYAVYPLGMAVIANALVAAGHTVRQLDCLASSVIDVQIKNLIADFQPELIGISLRNIDNVDYFTSRDHWSLLAVKALICKIKEQTQVPVVLGGSGFSIMPDEILDFCGGDYGIIGAGEEHITFLAHEISRGNTPQKLLGAKGHSAASAIGNALYDSELLDYYTAKSGVVNIQTKRGCPKRCLYCSYPLLEGNSIRPRDPLHVIEEIQFLQKTAEFKELFFTDAVFNDKRGHWLTLMETMASKNVRVPWTAFFEPDNITREALRLGKRTGLKALEFGTDACSDTTLKAMQKGFTFAAAHASTQLCVAEKLPCLHFVIAGGPGETSTTLKEGMHNIATLPQCLVAVFLGVRILPGTPMQQRAIEEGIVAVGQSLLKPHYYFSPQLTEHEADTIIKNAFKGNRFRLYPPSESDFRMRFLQKNGNRGILWDSMIQFPTQ